MNPNQALWEKGDFTRIAETMRESGEALVQRIGIEKGLKVLDLGCGDGTTALPAAKLGADVLGVDIALNLVEAGNKRAAKHGLANLKFQEGDATHLHELPDKAFGIESSVIERFAAAGVSSKKISFVRDTFTFNFPGAPSVLVDEFRKYYGPTMNAFDTAEKNGRAAELQKELEDLFDSQNKSPRKDATSIPATFLRVTVAL